MPLELVQQIESTLPINVEGLLPATVRELSNSAISKLPVYHGNQKTFVGDLFTVAGSAKDDESVHFSGHLKSVNGIGKKTTTGTISIEGNVGQHVGSYMSGGSIVVRGNTGDFLGMGMTGGEIKLHGNAGDHVGANYPGAHIGMNRGSIFVSGNVGRGAGQWMRRGNIVVAGDAGVGAGWNMQAGTLIVLNNSTVAFGTNMKRGTIVLGNRPASPEINPMFAAGPISRPPILVMLTRWLNQQEFELPLKKMEQTFRLFHGDQLRGGRGEFFVPASK